MVFGQSGRRHLVTTMCFQSNIPIGIGMDPTKSWVSDTRLPLKKCDMLTMNLFFPLRSALELSRHTHSRTGGKSLAAEQGSTYLPRDGATQDWEWYQSMCDKLRLNPQNER